MMSRRRRLRLWARMSSTCWPVEKKKKALSFLSAADQSFLLFIYVVVFWEVSHRPFFSFFFFWVYFSSTSFSSRFSLFLCFFPIIIQTLLFDHLPDQVYWYIIWWCVWEQRVKDSSVFKNLFKRKATKRERERESQSVRLK